MPTSPTSRSIQHVGQVAINAGDTDAYTVTVTFHGRPLDAGPASVMRRRADAGPGRLQRRHRQLQRRRLRPQCRLHRHPRAGHPDHGRRAGRRQRCAVHLLFDRAAQFHAGDHAHDQAARQGRQARGDLRRADAQRPLSCTRGPAVRRRGPRHRLAGLEVRERPVVGRRLRRVPAGRPPRGDRGHATAEAKVAYPAATAGCANPQQVSADLAIVKNASVARSAPAAASTGCSTSPTTDPTRRRPS